MRRTHPGKRALLAGFERAFQCSLIPGEQSGCSTQFVPGIDNQITAKERFPTQIERRTQPHGRLMETYLTPYGRERLQAGDAIVKQVEQQPGAVPDERDLDQVSLVSLATSLRTWVCRIGFRPGGGKWRVGTAMGGRRETTKRQIEQFQHSIKKGEPAFALVLTLAEKQVQEIDIIANPEKLRHIPALSFEEEI